MRISFSATNPCHLYPLAREVAALDALHCYYSGYPKWRLPDSDTLPVRTHSFRTLITYGLLRLPENLRPKDRSLFTWQDTGFDRWTGRVLETCDEIHAMPGQCLETFRRARRLGIRTVLNHATGPVKEWVRIMEPEYARIGRSLALESRYDAAYFERESQEYALADVHCVASSVVRDQLMAGGIPENRIWVVPYGADPVVFHARGANRAGPFRIIFAGQLSVRKGLHVLLEALKLSCRSDWVVDFYGRAMEEVGKDLGNYRGAPQLHFHGAVDQLALAAAFRAGSVLVLPSLEEGFGLVIPQALSCGLPCVVSDRVGAKDLLQPGVTGSVFASCDAESLLNELRFREENPVVLNQPMPWTQPARTLLQLPR